MNPHSFTALPADDDAQGATPASTADGSNGAIAAGGDASSEIAFTSLLAEDLAGRLEDGDGAAFSGAHEYDGHVALALDTGILPDIDSALDLLTSSHHLFDVPAIDLGAADDSMPT
jgi:hypothetical protein